MQVQVARRKIIWKVGQQLHIVERIYRRQRTGSLPSLHWYWATYLWSIRFEYSLRVSILSQFEQFSTHHLYSFAKC